MQETQLTSNWSISYQHTGCYGTCPSYNLHFRSDGSSLWEGKKYCAPEGVAQAQLSMDLLIKLKKSIDACDLLHKPMNYILQPVDVSAHIIQYREGDLLKSITWRSGQPPCLDSLIHILQRCASSLQWQTDFVPAKPSPEIPGELILQVDSIQVIDALEIKYPGYQLKRNRALTKNNKIWLIQYDPSQNVKWLMGLLSDEPGVINVEQNKRLEIRK